MACCWANFVKAKSGAQKNIEHRNGMVKVKLNGQPVANRASVVMFRNPRIREFKK